MMATQEFQHRSEGYANAPLLVAVEISFLETSSDIDTDLFPALREVIGAGRTEFGGRFRVTGQPEPDEANAETMLFRLTNDSSTVSVAAWLSSLIIECSEYERYEQFVAVVRGIVDAYARFMEPASVTRFGMRYIDEVHVPEPITSVRAWGRYVNPVLVAPASLVDNYVINLSAGFTLDLGEHRTINVGYGTSPTRELMNEGPLVLRERPDTPAFVLDIDAVYQPPDPQPGPVDGDLIAGLADALKPGVRRIFEAVFTADARHTFRSQEPAS